MRDAIAEHGTTYPPEPGSTRWRCFRCAARLAWFDRGGLRFRPGITRLDGQRDGMSRYGDPSARHPHRPRPIGKDPEPPRRIPLLIYCPACGAEQRLAP